MSARVHTYMPRLLAVASSGRVLSCPLYRDGGCSSERPRWGLGSHREEEAEPSPQMDLAAPSPSRLGSPWGSPLSLLQGISWDAEPRHTVPFAVSHFGGDTSRTGILALTEPAGALWLTSGMLLGVPWAR